MALRKGGPGARKSKESTIYCTIERESEPFLVDKTKSSLKKREKGLHLKLISEFSIFVMKSWCFPKKKCLHK